MNIMSRLANVLTGKPADAEEVELSPEEQAAEEKAARIKFHREEVRNGPVKFRQVTNGQVRRAQARAQRREIQRNFKREVRSYFERQRFAATVRSHLQIVGVIPFYDRHEAPLHDQIVSTGWLLQRFGVEVVTDEGVGTGHISFREGDVLDGIRAATKFYNGATGSEFRVPADFVPAFVAVDA